MDHLPQELIDEIIDRLPLDHMTICSIVARTWRRRSQQRHFESIWFDEEDDIDCWNAKISQNPEGIPSYVHSVRFMDLKRREKVAVLNRILQYFVNLRSLNLIRVDLSLLCESRGPSSFGSFGSGVTKLVINDPLCGCRSFVSLILSFPNLETLVLFKTKPIGRPQFPSSNIQKRVLEQLILYGAGPEVTEVLAQCSLSFRAITIKRLFEEPPSEHLAALLAASSKDVKTVTLRDLTYSPHEEGHLRHPNPGLPSLIALRELRVMGRDIRAPPTWLANIMVSAPELPSIHFNFGMSSDVRIERWALDERWMLIDGWVARLARNRRGSTTLVVVLLIPFDGEPPRLGYFLSEARSVGVEVRVVNRIPL